jgi:cell wall-associated NlpC family hydrolase
VDHAKLRSHLVKQAKSWIGVPYSYGGMTRSGVDCSGLTSRLYQDIGYNIPRRASEQFETGKWVSGKGVFPGDLVFFQNTAGKGITHVGMYIGDGSFIHASTSNGVVISTFADLYYRAHYAGARCVVCESK